MAQIDIKNCNVRIVDGTSPTPNKLLIKIGEGNLTYDEKRTFIYYRDRGILDSVREGDQEPMDVKLDATWEHITADTGQPATIEDALKKRNGCSAWDSSDADACNPYAVDIEIEYTPPCTENSEMIVLPDFRYESIAHDLKAATFSISGKCNVTQALVSYLTRSSDSGNGA
jgi:hypothetical protein